MNPTVLVAGSSDASDATKLLREDIIDRNTFYISSLHDAHLLLRKYMVPQRAYHRREIVEYITDPVNQVRGMSKDYFNFVLDLFDVGDYDLVIKICEYALQSLPFDRDLLAAAIRACGDSGQFEKGEQFLQKAEQIAKRLWTYRLFHFSVVFLMHKLDANPVDEALCQRAVQLAKEYIEHFPHNESGYNQHAQLLLMMNKRDEAIVALTRYIKNTRPDEQTEYFLVTSQCCLTLLGILDESSNYDLIIETCDIALRNAAQAQPITKIGFFVYRKALALDAKARALMAQGLSAQDVIADALEFYQSAYDLNQGRDYARIVEQRYAALRPHTKEYQPLIKRNLFVLDTQIMHTEADDPE